MKEQPEEVKFRWDDRVLVGETGVNAMTTTDTRGELTARQAEIYDAILAHVERTGRVPTLREIMAATGIASTNGVDCHLVALGRKGWLTFGGGTSRGIDVPELTAGVKRLAAALRRDRAGPPP